MCDDERKGKSRSVNVREEDPRSKTVVRSDNWKDKGVQVNSNGWRAVRSFAVAESGHGC